jgi:hypothetical protein
MLWGILFIVTNGVTQIHAAPMVTLGNTLFVFASGLGLCFRF